MTVRELIERLQQINPDLSVVVYGQDRKQYVHGVELKEGPRDDVEEGWDREDGMSYPYVIVG